MPSPYSQSILILFIVSFPNPYNELVTSPSGYLEVILNSLIAK